VSLEPAAPNLPPLSTFRGAGSSMVPADDVCTSSTLVYQAFTGRVPAGSGTGGMAQTGDALGKALASVSELSTSDCC